ncbi:MAG TPA: YbaK/EbsC family protein [Candidatus Limiplasma sp.]|nr:YbaK/EbsC family protein [Candidatus Limiplasma sp.]HPS80947.1 YbaK/EbsC family protein [Candidatus Limiplasma sp.]
MQTRLEVRQTIVGWLDERQIPYRMFEHPQANTIDDCLTMPFISDSVTICKNVFLCNRQKTNYYLMLLRPNTPFRTAIVSKALGVSRLSFAPDDALQTLLHLTSGSVSPLALYFDRAHEIVLCYEKAVRETPEIAFHPCDNTATVLFTQDVFWGRVLPELGVRPVAVERVE